MKIEIINKIKETLDRCPVKTYEELFTQLSGNKNIVVTRLSNVFDLETIGAVSLDSLVSSLLDQTQIREGEEPVEIGFSQSGFKYIVVTLCGSKLLLTRMGSEEGIWTATICRGRYQFFNPWETMFNHSRVSEEQFCKLIYVLSICSENNVDFQEHTMSSELEVAQTTPVQHDALSRSVIVDSVVKFRQVTKRFRAGGELCDIVATIVAIKLHGLTISDIKRKHAASGFVDEEFGKLF